MANPIVVDVDGTLLKSDLLIESFFSLLSAAPTKAIKAVGELRSGKAALKLRLADEAVVEIESLPLNEEVLNFLVEKRASGRRIYLASASDRRYVEALATHLGLFDGVFGSEGGVNLAGEAKARLLVSTFGEGGFDYIGDAAVDEAVWRRAGKVYIANARPAHLTAVRGFAPDAEAIGHRSHVWTPYLRTLRPHQWLKNTLIFVPALAAHALIGNLWLCIAAFFSFSLCASSVYILNDLLDLRNDRAHPRKRSRPFAAGTVPIIHGAAAFPLLLLGSFALALLLPLDFLLVLAGYYALTCAYSFVLKRHMVVDVISLACLYGCRLVAGSAAANLPLSPWLIAFAIFVFLCLALVKRCSELIDRKQKDKGDPPGRGYRLADLPALQGMAAASGYISVLVLALYINSDAMRVLYRYPDRLWLICIVVLYWVSRTLLLTHRGEMHDDPVVFAATDRVSQMIALILFAALAIAL